MPIPIPQHLRERLETVRALHLDALDEGLDLLDDEIAAAGREAIRKIRESGYKPAVIRHETRRLLKGNNRRVRRWVAEQVTDAASAADQVADYMRAWSVSKRLRDLPTSKIIGPIAPSDVIKAQQQGTSAVEAALARVKRARLRTPAEQDAALRAYGGRSGQLPRTPKKVPQSARGPVKSGLPQLREDKARGLIKSNKQIGLSRRLHGSAARNVHTTERAVGRIVREGQRLDLAGKTIIHEVERGGDALSVNRRLTKPLERFQKAGRRLNELSLDKSDTPAARAARRKARREYNQAFGRIKRDASRLVDKRGGSKEFIQTIKKHGHKATDSALDRWLGEKQRSHAERIARTETSAAYRDREYEGVKNKKYVTGAIWRLNIGARRQYTRRKKIPRKGKSKGRRCVCEGYAGQFFSKSAIGGTDGGDGLSRMGHPNCLCWWEWVYSVRGLAKEPLTDADLEWYRNLPD
jgi:hypothetical protein